MKSQSKTKPKKTNMYEHCIQRINVAVGCKHACVYCRKSFQAQMKRQKQNCQQCYEFVPHVHEDRIKTYLKKTQGFEFIWFNASSDIAFCSPVILKKILARIREYPDRTFFLQTKDPDCLIGYAWPKNILLGITLETNRDSGYKKYSQAPLPTVRYRQFQEIAHPRKSVTIEPILDFDVNILLEWLRVLHPERVYVGFDTKKCNLPDPPINKVKTLVTGLATFTRVFCKYMKGEQIHDETQLKQLHLTKNLTLD